MKKRIRRLVVIGLIVVSVLGLGSCGVILGFVFPSEFVLDGATFPLARLYVLNWGTNSSGTYDLEVYLLPDTMTMDAEGYLQGTGDYAWFWINTTAPALGEDAYDYNALVGSFPAGTLYWGGANLGFGTASPSSYYLEGGTLDVSTSIIGDEFILDYYDGGTDAGAQFEARFRGEMALSVINVVYNVRSENVTK